MRNAPSRSSARALVLLCASLAAGAWALVALAMSPRYSPANALSFVLLFCSLLFPVLTCVLRPAAGRGAGVGEIGGLDICQPGVVVALFYYFYMVIPALHIWHDLGLHSTWIDPTWPPERVFNVTCALGLLGLVAFGAGYHAGLGRPPGRAIGMLFPRGAVAWSSAAWGVVAAMIAVGLVFKLYHLAAFGGLSPRVLLYLSPSYAIESGVKIGGVPTLLESLFDWGVLLLLFRSVTTGRYRVVALALTGLALLLAYLLSGKRSAIVPFLLFPAVWYHYLRRRIGVGRGLVYLAGGLVLTVLLLLMRSVGPLLVTAGGATFTGRAVDILVQPVRFFLYSPELTVYDMTMLAVQDRAFFLHSVGGPFWGGLQHNVAPLTYVIPRFLWPTKPAFADFGTLFYERAIGDRPEIGFSVGLVGGAYVFAGVIGVALAMALVGVVSRWVYDVLRPRMDGPWQVFLYSIFLWMAFLLVRFGTLGSTVMFFFQYELVGVLAALVIALWLGPRHPSMK